jgi:hypothetical protein
MEKRERAGHPPTSPGRTLLGQDRRTASVNADAEKTIFHEVCILSQALPMNVSYDGFVSDHAGYIVLGLFVGVWLLFSKAKLGYKLILFLIAMLGVYTADREYAGPARLRYPHINFLSLTVWLVGVLLLVYNTFFDGE